MIYLKEGHVPLNDAYRDEIKQEANSTYQLSFRLPTNQGNNVWQEIRQETLIVADDLAGKQEFVVIETERQLGYMVVYANQVATLLNGVGIGVLSVDRGTGVTVMNRLAASLLRETPFTFTSDIMDQHTLNLSNCTAMDALAKGKHSIIGQWGGDLIRDGYNIRLMERAGRVTEALFMYKKNIKTYQRNRDYKNLMTRIHFSKTIQGSGDEPDQVIRVTLDSPMIKFYKNIYEGFINVSDDTVTDEASLRRYGQRYYDKTQCDFVQKTLKLDVSGIDTDVQLFDYVGVRYDDYEEIWGQQITSYEFSPMRRKLMSIGFGDRSSTSSLGRAIDSAVSTQVSDQMIDIDINLQRELENSRRAFEAQYEKRKKDIEDAIEKSRAKAEEEAEKLRSDIAAQWEATKDQWATDMYHKFLEDVGKPDSEAKRVIEANIGVNEAKLAEALDGKLKDIDTRIEKTTLAPIDDLRKKLDATSEVARINTELIGGDGTVSYNKNRLKGESDRTIPFKTDYIEVTHNGDGFVVGQPYTISWEATCVPYGHKDVRVVSRVGWFVGGGHLRLAPRDTAFPMIQQDVSKRETVVPMVYFGTYDLTLTHNWYQTIHQTAEVTEASGDIVLPLIFKTVADGNSLESVETSWSENPDIIFDGGESE